MKFGIEENTSVAQLPIAKLIKNILLYFTIVFVISLLLNKAFDAVFTKVHEIDEIDLTIMLLLEIIVQFTILIVVFAHVIDFARQNILNDENVSYELIDAFVLAYTLVSTQTNLAAKMDRFTKLF